MWSQTKPISPCCVWPLTLILFLLLGTPPGRADDATPPQQVAVAEKLVGDLHGASVNAYGQGHRFIHWKKSDCGARTVCSSFMTLLLEHTYGWDDHEVKTWLGSTDPDAAPYHNAIVLENGFSRLRQISDIRPGDVIAIKYNDGSADTGHVMLVDAVPEARAASDPIIPDTTQYAVTVIDSSASGHGPTDTRYRSPGHYTGGIGRGVFRLYANSDGKIVGYAWSLLPKSEYYTRPARALVMGRLTKH